MTDLPKILAEILTKLQTAKIALDDTENSLRRIVLCNDREKAPNANATPAAETLNPAASGGEGWPRYWVAGGFIYRGSFSEDRGELWTGKAWTKCSDETPLARFAKEVHWHELTPAEAAKLGASV